MFTPHIFTNQHNGLTYHSPPLKSSCDFLLHTLSNAWVHSILSASTLWWSADGCWVLICGQLLGPWLKLALLQWVRRELPSQVRRIASLAVTSTADDSPHKLSLGQLQALLCWHDTCSNECQWRLGNGFFLWTPQFGPTKDQKKIVCKKERGIKTVVQMNQNQPSLCGSPFPSNPSANPSCSQAPSALADCSIGILSKRPMLGANIKVKHHESILNSRIHSTTNLVGHLD